MQLKIEKLVYGGDGLARLPGDDRGPGKSVFLPFALEGEKVEAELTEQKSGFARARLKSIVEPAQTRIDALCRYFQSCGGCHYQHTGYADQLMIKSKILRETLRRTAKFELDCELHVHPSPEWNYRNRTRLKVRAAPEFAIGYYRHRSHELLPVRTCPISSPLINAVMAAIWVRGPQVSSAVREIELFASESDTEVLAEIYCSPGTARTEAREVAEYFGKILPQIRGVSVFQQAPERAFTEPRRLAGVGVEVLAYQTTGATYRVSAGSFFQANRFLIDHLVGLATEGVSGKQAVDLYAGVGLFSAVLARSFRRVIAVEASQTSYNDLRHNCGPEVKAVRATSEKYLAQASGIHPDLVLADPPRGGLGESVVRSLAKLGSARVTYVSCDPSTLARDLRLFVSLGYRIKGAHLIDLFPQTFHIESVFHLAG